MQSRISRSYVLSRAAAIISLCWFNACFTATPGLVVAFSFDENAGTITSDASGNANQGSVSGATWVSGRYGSSLRFNGTNALVTVADANSLDLTNAFTIEAWVYPTASSSWRTVVIKDKPSGLAYAIYSP